MARKGYIPYRSMTRFASHNIVLCFHRPYGRPATSSMEDVLHFAERLEAELLPEAAQTAVHEAA